MYHLDRCHSMFSSFESPRTHHLKPLWRPMSYNLIAHAETKI